jgi:hypothetical protein
MSDVYFVIREDTRQERFALGLLRDMRAQSFPLEQNAQAPACSTPIFVHTGVFQRTDRKGKSRTLHNKILRVGRQSLLFTDFKSEPPAWMQNTSTCIALRPFSGAELDCPKFAMRLRNALHEARRVSKWIASVDYEAYQKELRKARKLAIA